ncbi:MAG: hypothetical protein IKA49_01735, partial [Alistipes sp.]|nr:hypothetical protein [Alistipes sp.]
MAGGVGTRFWPESRQSKPKQFLDICDTGKSFIRMTFERFSAIVPTENFLVVTNARYKDLVLEHIPELREEQILCEPIGRNTAPCIGYAAYRLRKTAPDATMIVTPADHLVLNESEFVKIANDALDFVAKNDALMTIGITPSRPISCKPHFLQFFLQKNYCNYTAVLLFTIRMSKNGFWKKYGTFILYN